MGRFRGTLKMASFLILISFVITIIFFSTPPSISKLSIPEISYTPQSITSCQNGVCNSIFYSYEKYFLRDGIWKEINENFFACAEGFCTNNYHFQTIATSKGEVSTIFQNSNITFQLDSFLDYNLSFKSEIDKNIITYHIVPGYVDLQYQYFPRKLKETLIIKQPLPSLTKEDINITFSKSGTLSFFLEEPTVCDAKHNCTTIPLWTTDDQLTIQVPGSFLNDPELQYPLEIDPTIYLDDSNITWNGYVTETVLALHQRTSNPSPRPLRVGKSVPAPPLTGTNIHRAGIEFDISSIPDDSKITEVLLKIDVGSLGTGLNNNVSFNHMELNSTDYSDNEAGNTLFYKDMANGTTYNITNFTASGEHIINVTNAATDLGTQMRTEEWFGFGIVSIKEYQAGAPVAHLAIRSRDDSTPSKRPYLNVTYIPFANELEGDAAIEEGINNSLPHNPIHSDQQIYIATTGGSHSLGSFDKATTSANQSWAFNYVTDGENFTNMTSLYNTVNIGESEDLTYSEIVTTVSSFIDSTKE